MPIFKGVLGGFWHVIAMNPSEHCIPLYLLDTALQLTLEVGDLNIYRRDHSFY